MACTRPVPFRVRHRRTLEDLPRKHAEQLFRINTRNLGWHGNALLVKKHVDVMDVAALELPTGTARRGGRPLLIGDRPLR